MRKIVCQGMVFRMCNGHVEVLLCQRGKAARSEVGKWCIPGGHLENDETLEQCVSREIKEETNVDVRPDEWTLYRVDSDSRMPVICANYVHVLPDESDAECKCSNINVPEEISDVRFVSIEDIEVLDWAFNRDDMVSLIRDAYDFIQ